MVSGRVPDWRGLDRVDRRPRFPWIVAAVWMLPPQARAAGRTALLGSFPLTAPAGRLAGQPGTRSVGRAGQPGARVRLSPGSKSVESAGTTEEHTGSGSTGGLHLCDRLRRDSDDGVVLDCSVGGSRRGDESSPAGGRCDWSAGDGGSVTGDDADDDGDDDES
nr:hypothetical protein CFP56_34920 [Quercus suber]